MRENLENKKCKPCEGGTDVLSTEQSETLIKEISDWTLVENKIIKREFGFKNFKEALSFVNKVGNVAEEEGHHPDINLHSWNKVEITLSTHAIGGLSENDFIMASKIDRLLN